MVAHKFGAANLLITPSSLPDVQIMICITSAHNAAWLVTGILLFTKIGLGSWSSSRPMIFSANPHIVGLHLKNNPIGYFNNETK